MNKPIISFLMCVRVRTDLNNPKTRDIYKFFRDGIIEITEKDREKVEFLIKFDEDDDQAKKIINRFKDFPLKIKFFFFARGEGMYFAHYNYSYLLARINPNSKYVCFCGDDSIIQHFSRGGNIEELINNKQKYVFYSPRNYVLDLKNYISFTNFNNNAIDVINNKVCEPYPLLSKNILEICGMGFHHNIDSWFALLNTYLITEFKISILKKLPSQHLLRDNTQKEDIINNSFVIPEGGYRSKFNIDLLNLKYYLILAKQQAFNIFLNIEKEGLLNEYAI